MYICITVPVPELEVSDTEKLNPSDTEHHFDVPEPTYEHQVSEGKQNSNIGAVLIM